MIYHNGHYVYLYCSHVMHLSINHILYYCGANYTSEKEICPTTIKRLYNQLEHGLERILCDQENKNREINDVNKAIYKGDGCNWRL